MYVYIKKQWEQNWVDITKYVNGDIVIVDVAEGSRDTANFTLHLNEDFNYLPYNQPIPPKLQIKISEVETQSQQNDNNTYWFLVQDTRAKRVRRKVQGKVKELYKHEVDCLEYSALTEDKNLPNYTITQPKTQFFNMYSRYGFRDYRFNYLFQYDGINNKRLPASSQFTDNFINVNNNQIDFGYEISTNRYFMELRELDELGYQVSVELDIRQTAKTFTVGGFLNLKTDIFAGFTPFFSTNTTTNFLTVRTITKYYENEGDSVSAEDVIENQTLIYQGGQIQSSNGVITQFPANTLTSQFRINVAKRDEYKYAKIYIEIQPNSRTLYNLEFVRDTARTLSTNIPNTTNNNIVKAEIQGIRMSATSSQTQDPIVEQKTTLRNIMEKALYDYNMNKRYTVSLDPQTAVLLDVEAKEAEFEEYDLRELIERIFKYVGATYYLTDKNVIKHIIPSKQAVEYDLDTAKELDLEHNYADRIDSILSKSKNLMSQDDFVKERVLIGSTQPEQSQFTDQTAGFLTSNNIYFLGNGKLYTPNFSVTFTIDGQPFIVNSNIEGESHVWDITSRFLEEDIYNALPNARFDTAKTMTEPSQRVTGELGQGNTIKYKSGSNIISGVTHQAPTIPDFNFLVGTVIGKEAEYAMVEMLICLAYESLDVPPLDIGDPEKIDFEFDEIKDWELEITYVPIFDEITTKFISNMKDRFGLNWEKKVNVNERVISFEDSENILKLEMESKGNVETSATDIVRSFAETLPIMSIINNNLYITDKRMVISPNGLIDVTYKLQQNFILLNSDMGLSVEFERFAVPYEYVKREMIIENHMIFSKVKKDTYVIEQVNVVKLLKDLYETGNIEGSLYAKLNLKYRNSVEREVLMRIAKLEARFTMILSGKFIDNYGAGYQRFGGIGGTVFSQPYRYVDYQGKVEEVYLMALGYTENVAANSSRLMVIEDGSTIYNYPLIRFPEAKWVNQNSDTIDTLMNVLYYGDNTDDNLIAVKKDAREGLALNIHNFLESEDYDIKFYSFKKINKIGVMTKQIPLTDDLTINDIVNSLTNVQEASVEVGKDATDTYIRVAVDETFDESNLVLLNETNNRFTLVGIAYDVVRQLDGYIYIYVYGTKFGRNESGVPPIFYEIENQSTYDIVSVGEALVTLGLLKETNLNYDIESIGEAILTLGLLVDETNNFEIKSSGETTIILGKLEEEEFAFNLKSSGETQVQKLEWQTSGFLTAPYDFDLAIGQALPQATAPNQKLRRMLTQGTANWVDIGFGLGVQCLECPPISPAPIGTICACGGTRYEYQGTEATYEYFISAYV